MNKNSIRASYFSVFAIITSSSLFYLLVDFKTNDVIPSVRSYAAVQLVLTLTLFLLLLSSTKRHGKVGPPFIFNVVLWVLIIMQIIPALFWILFDGVTVAEYPWDSGIIGSWIYGAYHIVVIVWGVANFWWQLRASQTASDSNS